jgi:hypothetical protein
MHIPAQGATVLRRGEKCRPGQIPRLSGEIAEIAKKRLINLKLTMGF